jgi:DNA-binding NarL/FixJ family response regulator
MITDFEMPGMNGYEATRRIKAQWRPPRVVILSVHGEPEVIDRARRAGADGFILKGASHEVLVDAILAGTGSPGNQDLEEGS